jgi:hypothetical protein
MSDIRIFRVLRDKERTRVETDGHVLGWGIEFPNGACHVDWNRQAYPPENRLEHPHISQYGSFADVEQGTGGRIQVLETLEVNR